MKTLTEAVFSISSKHDRSTVHSHECARPSYPFPFIT